MERTRWAGLVAAGVALALGWATAARAAKDTLVIGMPTDIPIFDTHRVTGLHNMGIINQVSENLVRLSLAGEPLPWLAESWSQSRDGRTWTLNLRKGVVFTDGAPFTAEAVKVNIERFRKHSIGKAALALLDSMEAVDDHTLKLTTRGPYAPFIRTLGYVTIAMYSPAQIKKVGDENLHTAPVGTGPFKLVHHKKGQEVRLEANDGYWAGRPKLRTIIMKPIPEAGARVLALESGDVDLIFHVPPQEAARLAKNPSLTVHTPATARFIWIPLNTQKEPFRDKRVRQALMYAIDREAIVKNILAGMAKVMHSPGAIGSFGYTDRFERYAYNPDKARELLREAGHAQGLSFTLHHSPGRFILSGQVAEAIQAYLAKVNVQVRVVDLEWGAFSQATAQPLEKNVVQASYTGWRSVNGDLDSSIQDFGSKFWRPRGANDSFFKHAEYDRLLEFEQGTLDEKARLEALYKMQQILIDEVPALYLYAEPQIWASKKSLKGVEFSLLEALQPLHTANFE